MGNDKEVSGDSKDVNKISDSESENTLSKESPANNHTHKKIPKIFSFLLGELFDRKSKVINVIYCNVCKYKIHVVVFIDYENEYS